MFHPPYETGLLYSLYPNLKPHFLLKLNHIWKIPHPSANMLPIKSFTVFALLFAAASAVPERDVARAVEIREPEVVQAADLEDRNRDRRGCVSGAGGNVCLNGPYRKSNAKPERTRRTRVINTVSVAANQRRSEL